MLYKQIAFEDMPLRITPTGRNSGKTKLVPDYDIRAAFFLLTGPSILRLLPILFLLVFAYGCATTSVNTVPKGIYYSISQSSLEHGEPDKAIEGLTQVPKDQRDLKYHILIAKAYFMKGNYPLAIENYKMALEKDSNNEEAKLGMARVYMKMSKYDFAKKYLEELLKSTNQEIRLEAELELGLVYLKQGKYTEAEKILLKVLEQDAENWQAKFRLGLVYYDKSDLDKSITYYLAALSNVPASSKSEVYYNLGLAYYKKGDIGSAKDAWKGAVKFSPYGEYGRKAQSKLDLL